MIKCNDCGQKCPEDDILTCEGCCSDVCDECAPNGLCPSCAAEKAEAHDFDDEGD